MALLTRWAAVAPPQPHQHQQRERLLMLLRAAVLAAWPLLHAGRCVSLPRSPFWRRAAQWSKKNKTTNRLPPPGLPSDVERARERAALAARFLAAPPQESLSKVPN